MVLSHSNTHIQCTIKKYYTHTRLVAHGLGLTGWAAIRKDFTEARDSEWQRHHGVWMSHTHNCLTAFVRDYPGRLVPEETLTHSHPSCSSDILYQLPPFTTIHSILLVQFTCLTVLCDNLSLSRSSLVLDPLLHTPCISSPSHYLLFAAHAHTIAACSAAIQVLCHLYLVSLSAQYLEICLLV